MDKVYTVAIIGCGSRGCAYGNEMFALKDKYNIVTVCDIGQKHIDVVKNAWGISDENVYLDEKTFFEKKRADVLVIATQDRDHVRMGIRALELGYDILMEKPISPIKEELVKLLEAHKKYGGKILVCHVLRYAPAFVKVKELLDSGIIGKLVRIENIEQVKYWHQAHSFVRGNWRNDSETSPMIMQKCCHDLDLMEWYVGSRCDTVYSVGDISYFKRENQPKDAADRCQDCKYKNTCPYSAERLYVERWKKLGCPEYNWPFNVVCLDKPNTEQLLRAAYENSEYGRCVFACDNNVVDNQSVDMVFENGVKVSHVMTAFTGKMGRRITLHGTLGEIELFDDLNQVNVYKFGEEPVFYKISDLLAGDDEFGHGGGDSKLIKSLYEVLEGREHGGATLESSVESHLMALAAEESRKTGKIVKVHDENY